MIFIKKPPKFKIKKRSWLRRKFSAVERTSDAKKRSFLIGQLASIPPYVTDQLVDHCDGKCWYCERKLPRSELVVEHFRPKRRVARVNGHPGYFWLAANSKNFRISCKNCNCRWTNPDGLVYGKGNYFPLMDESKRVLSRSVDLRVEAPLLYDPLSAEDCNGLIFVEDGSCLPASDDYIEVSRAYSSIALYNLNNPHLMDSRKKLWNDIKFNASVAISLCSTDPALYSIILTKLRSMARDSAEYAGLARSAIQNVNGTMSICI